MLFYIHYVDKNKKRLTATTTEMASTIRIPQNLEVRSRDVTQARKNSISVGLSGDF